MRGDVIIIKVGWLKNENGSAYYSHMFRQHTTLISSLLIAGDAMYARKWSDTHEE